MLRKDPPGFKEPVKQDIEKTKEDIPKGFVMPTHQSTTVKKPEKIADDPDFWVNSESEVELWGEVGAIRMR